MLSLSNITKYYKGYPALENIDLKVAPGEVHGLVGVNGSGKTTLLNILSGQTVIRHTGGFSGSFLLDGKERAFSHPGQAIKAGIGMVHQAFALVPDLSVADNIALSGERIIPWTRKYLGRDLSLIDRQGNRKRARELLSAMGIDLDPDLPAGRLSVAMKQFVEMARELNRKHMKLLLLDEPTAVLGREDAQCLIRTVQSLADRGTAVVYVSHRLGEVAACCDRITVLQNGKKTGCLINGGGSQYSNSLKPPLKTIKTPIDSTKASLDSAKLPLNSAKAPLDSAKTPLNSAKAPLDSAKAPLDFAKAPLDFAKAPLNSAKAPLDSTKLPLNSTKVPLNSTKVPLNSAKAHLDSAKTPLDSAKAHPDSGRSDAHEANLIKAMSTLMVEGRVKKTTRRPVPSLKKKPILQVADFRADKAGDSLNGLDLTVFRGEILGITSLSGHGRTGLAAGLMGLCPASGKVIVNDRAVIEFSPPTMNDHGVWMLTEERETQGLLMDHSLVENMSFAPVQIGKGFVKKTILPFLRVADQKKCLDHARRSIKALDIRCRSVFQKAGELSGGNQQKVCLAHALAMAPALLFVTDPTRGVDIAAREAILDLLVTTHAREKMTLVISSGELEELRRVCDRIAVLYRGRLFAVLTPDRDEEAFALACSGIMPDSQPASPLATAPIPGPVALPDTCKSRADASITKPATQPGTCKSGPDAPEPNTHISWTGDPITNTDTPVSRTDAPITKPGHPISGANAPEPDTHISAAEAPRTKPVPPSSGAAAPNPATQISGTDVPITKPSPLISRTDAPTTKPVPPMKGVSP